MTVSASRLSFSNPTIALRILFVPSELNGSVTTATTREPLSLAQFAIMWALPVPVPPPRPQVMNTRS